MTESKLKDLHAVGYARVSTKDHTQTVKTQIRLIEEWAQKYGVIIDGIRYDQGKSGDMYPRPGLAMAICDLADSKASILVCTEQSRLTRNAPEDLAKIKKALPEGVIIRYTPYGDTDPDNIGVQIMDAVKGVTDNKELEDLHKRTKNGMDTRKRAGKHIGRPAKVVITDDPDKLPRGLIQQADGTRTPGTDLTKEDDERQRVYKGYARGTNVLTTSHVLSFAQKGLSMYKVSKLLGISPASFSRLLHDAKIYDEYQAIYSQVKGVA